MQGLNTDRPRRRSDWRFLLPASPDAQQVAHRASGRLLEALPACFPRVSELERHAPESVDLVVLSDAPAATIEEAWNVLRPGGALYVEWRGRIPRRHERARRELERIGFVDVACYWPYPDPDRNDSRFWLPLGAKHAIDHFIASRPPPTRRAVSLLSGIQAALWRGARRVGVLAPQCSVARKPPSQLTHSADGSLRSLACAFLSRVDLELRPDQVVLLLSTDSTGPNSKVVAQVFAGQPEPAMVVKASRSDGPRYSLMREAKQLDAVRLASPQIASDIPRVLFVDDRSERCSVGQTFVRGVQLERVLRLDSFAGVAEFVAEWLVELAGTPSASRRQDWWGRLIEEQLEAFGREFTPMVTQKELRHARERLSLLGDLPLVPEHGDLAPLNIHIALDRGIGVIDWEDCELRGLPLRDLLYFLVKAAFALERVYDQDNVESVYESLLDSSTPLGRGADAAISTYMDRLDLDSNIIPALRLSTWLSQALKEDSRPGSEAGSDTISAFRFLRLWKAELELAS